MVRYPTIEEIFELNPHIEREKFAEADELLRKLRDIKTRRANYGLPPPFARRGVSVVSDSVDRRTIYLRRHRT